jgi:thiosulfate dehydrogenase [quinone] large subunit
MDFPYIENVNNYLVDYHIVYAGVLVYLIVKRAGHVFGLDGWVAKLASVQHAPALRWMVAQHRACLASFVRGMKK